MFYPHMGAICRKAKELHVVVEIMLTRLPGANDPPEMPPPKDTTSKATRHNNS